MEKDQVIKVVDEAIVSFEKGTWTLPGFAIAILRALKYLVEKQ